MKHITFVQAKESFQAIKVRKSQCKFMLIFIMHIIGALILIRVVSQMSDPTVGFVTFNNNMTALVRILIFDGNHAGDLDKFKCTLKVLIFPKSIS